MIDEDVLARSEIPHFIREPVRESNPKTLMGRLKVPMSSVLPPSSMIAEALALQYGAFDAPKKDGSYGYGPYNWRDQAIEAMVYVDACQRHLAEWTDGEDCASDSMLCHLYHAKATLGILIDAIESKTCIDDRPKARNHAASRMLAEGKSTIAKRRALTRFEPGLHERAIAPQKYTRAVFDYANSAPVSTTPEEGTK